MAANATARPRCRHAAERHFVASLAIARGDPALSFGQFTLMESTAANIFDEVDRQLLNFARAATPCRSAPKSPHARIAAIPLVAAPPFIPELTADALPRECRISGRNDKPAPRTGLMIAGIVVAVLGLGLIAAINLLHLFDEQTPLTGKTAIDSVAERILTVESSGGIDIRNKRSSAVGPAQFLDETWLEMIRAYRPDLVKGHTREQLLALRERTGLSREIAKRFAERNAAVLRRRGVPVTAGTLYLAHFAGAAGAAALLSAPAEADAAWIMAKADASGKTKREQIVKANPFLDKLTAGELKHWADRKMDGPALVLTELLSANTKK